MKKIKQYIINFLKKIGFNIVQVRGLARLMVLNPDGSLVSDTGFQENIITNLGLAALAGLAGNTGAITAFGYLEVGTSSTAALASQTTLVAAITDTGLARAAATVSRSTTTQTNDTLQFDYSWTASGSKTVLEIGVFNAASAGVMLARKVTTSTAVTNGQVLVGQYKIIFA